MNQHYQEQYLSSEEYHNGLQYILWFFVIIFSIISSVSLSLIIYLSANNEWGIAKYYSNSSIDFAINTFPFPLLPLVIPGLLFAIILFNFTNSGRVLSFYSSVVILSFLVIFSSLLFFYTGISKKINSSLNNYKIYELVIKNRSEIWQNPDFGLLSGEIGAVVDLDNFSLIDFHNKIWTIKSNSPKIIDNSIVVPGEKIKILGRKSDNNIFEAKEIRPY